MITVTRRAVVAYFALLSGLVLLVLVSSPGGTSLAAGVVRQSSASEASNLKVSVSALEISGTETIVHLSVEGTDGDPAPLGVAIHDGLTWEGFHEGEPRFRTLEGNRFQAELPALLSLSGSASPTITLNSVAVLWSSGVREIVEGPWVLILEIEDSPEVEGWMRTETLSGATVEFNDGSTIPVNGIRSRTRTIMTLDVPSTMTTLDPPQLHLIGGQSLAGDYERRGNLVNAVFAHTEWGSQVRLQLGAIIDRSSAGEFSMTVVDLSGAEIVTETRAALDDETAATSEQLFTIDPSRLVERGSIVPIQYGVGAVDDQPTLSFVVLGGWLPEHTPLRVFDGHGNELRISDIGSSFGPISGFDGITELPEGGATKIRFWLETDSAAVPVFRLESDYAPFYRTSSPVLLEVDP